MTKFVLTCLLFALNGTEKSAAAVSDPVGLYNMCNIVDVQAENNGLDPFMVLGVFWAESRFDPYAVNPRSGARGLGGLIVKWLGTKYTPNHMRADKTEVMSWEYGAEIAMIVMLHWKDHRNQDDWLACYAAGVSCDNDGYVTTVLKHTKNLERLYEKVQ